MTEVRNSDVGIPEKDIDRKWERFFRASTARGPASRAAASGLP